MKRPLGRQTRRSDHFLSFFGDDRACLILLMKPDLRLGVEGEAGVEGAVL